MAREYRFCVPNSYNISMPPIKAAPQHMFVAVSSPASTLIKIAQLVRPTQRNANHHTQGRDDDGNLNSAPHTCPPAMHDLDAATTHP
ncbi:MAG: hypothetical protein KDA66_19505 [Planctomycetaceae bacterium]|nr:hypothetical protein [Planctomycetaceae bacterium]